MSGLGQVFEQGLLTKAAGAVLWIIIYYLMALRPLFDL